MQQKFSFKNSKGDTLVGILSNPNSGKKNPIIVLCHGFATNKDVNTYIRLEKALNEKGIPTFRFDFLGHGESDGKFEDTTISEAMDDALQAISFVKKQGFSKVGLFGSSFGGMAALLAAAKTPGMFVLALKSPVSDHLGKIIADEGNLSIEHWKNTSFILHESSVMGKPRLNYSFYEDAERISVFDVAEQISAPTLIVHGSQDRVVPIDQSRKTASLIPNCRLEVLEGADHKYSKPEHFERMLKLVSEFVAETV